MSDRVQHTEGSYLLGAIMAKKKLSKADIASKAGSTETAVWYWLAGMRKPSAHFAWKLEEEFGVKAGLWGQPRK